MPGHDGDRDRVVPGGAAHAGDQRSRPVLAGSSGEDEDRDILVVLDQAEDLVRGGALALGRGTRRGAAGFFARFSLGIGSFYRRTKPTMSLTAFMVSAASAWARAEPSASTESM